ncbi:hypothetical protein Zmor_009990 [Zophobas morio]|uniref:Transposable element P transposase n=1 Tax=Zophobas morio TaxID=2755281 RepID=A0AA38MJ64_9CUCU|nr:hypothetical protein Zmor_009990 [Zophobas morio]
MKNIEIAKNLKIIIRLLQEIGLKVAATVCDQYNKASIQSLVRESKEERQRNGYSHETFTFYVNDEEIFPFFDFPHLLKGLRNNMLNYDVKFRWKNEEEIAMWDHIEQLYDLDCSVDADFRMLPKLTDAHIKRDHIKKMKVKNAAQVFSHKVQSSMRALVHHGRDVLPKAAIGTANFILFVDKLFDSVNGSCIEPKDGKILRRATTAKTEHMLFWDEAIKVLQSIKFFGRKKEFVPPTVTNWILSLRNLKLLWAYLQSEGFQFLLTRNVNQDPLENFFSCIRNQGARNVNPSCNNFTASFKTLILNNFMSTHSAGANCEEDESDGALQRLKIFLDVSPSETASRDETLQLHGYLAGYMSKKMLKAIGQCATCRKVLITDVDSDEYTIIKYREYKPNALLRPRTKYRIRERQSSLLDAWLEWLQELSSACSRVTHL